MANECRAWLWQVYQHTRATSRESLHSYFRGQTKKNDLTPEIMNMVSNAVKAVIPAEAPDGARCDLSHDSTPDWTIDKQQCATDLYCQVAEHLLQKFFPQQQPLLPETGEAAAKRFKGLVRAAHNPDCYELMKSHEFHLPLVECALHVTAFSVEGPKQHYPWATEVLQRQSYAPTLWWAARSFVQCFSPESSFPMPHELLQHLQHMQTRLLDQPLLSTGSLFYGMMEQGGGGMYQAGDTGMVAEILGAYAQQALQKAQLVGWQMQQQQRQQQLADPSQPGILHQQNSQQQQLPDTFHEQCAWLMDKLLLEHQDVCFGQHMSVVVACVAYVAAKLLQVNITFRRVTEVTLLCARHTPAEVYQHAEIQPATQTADPGATTAPQYGDIRMFYNTRFLPAMEPTIRQYMQDYQEIVQTTTTAAAAGVDDSEPSHTAAVAPELTGTPFTRKPLAGLTHNALIHGAAAVLDGKAAACTKGGKRATATADAIMEDANMENVCPGAVAVGGPSNPFSTMYGISVQPARLATSITPTRHMR